MKNITLTLLAATAIGAVSIGSASAMPFNNLSPALGESHVQNVRVVCNQNGRCYNTNRVNRSARGYVNRSARAYHAPRYYDNHAYYGGPGYYAAPGYYSGPRIGLGIGPFGFGVW
jgi:hypothetical protein